MITLINDPVNLPIQLMDNGTPVLGITSEDIQVSIILPHAPYVVIPQEDNITLVEIIDGFYRLEIVQEASLEVGNYIALVVSNEPVDAAFEALQLPYSVTPKPVGANIPANICIVHGNIKDISGRDMAGSTPIIFRNVDFPGVQGSSLINANKYETNTDAFGNFSAPLIRGRKVNMEIQAAGLRVQFTVPDLQTASVTDLFPT
jgi:hypothetical protein